MVKYGYNVLLEQHLTAVPSCNKSKGTYDQVLIYNNCFDISSFYLGLARRKGILSMGVSAIFIYLTSRAERFISRIGAATFQ